MKKEVCFKMQTKMRSKEESFIAYPKQIFKKIGKTLVFVGESFFGSVKSHHHNPSKYEFPPVHFHEKGPPQYLPGYTVKSFLEIHESSRERHVSSNVFFF